MEKVIDLSKVKVSSVKNIKHLSILLKNWDNTLSENHDPKVYNEPLHLKKPKALK
jgi:hypothetical protein